MKKVWIIVSAAVLVLIAAAGVVLLCLPRGQVIDSGDTDCLYPYSYRKTKNGTLVTVTGEFPEGYGWTAETDRKSVLSVQDAAQKEKAASFLLQPREGGSARVILSLAGSEGLFTDRAYEIDLAVLVGADGALNVYESTHREPERLISGGNEHFSYYIQPETDGSALLAVTEAHDGGWELSTEGDAVDVRPDKGIDRRTQENGESGDMGFYRVMGREAGEGTVILYSWEYGQAAVLSFDCDGQTVRVTDHTISADHAAPVREDACYEAYKALLGEPKLPKTAALTDINTLLWVSRADGETTFTVGRAGFDMDGRSWTLYASDTAGIDDLTADLTDGIADSREIAVGERTFALNACDGGIFSAWTDAAGRSFFLWCDGAALDGAAVPAERIIRASIGG